MSSIPVPIIAALVTAISGALVALSIQLAFTWKQHVRVQRVELLHHQLEFAYAPLDYWLSTLVSLNCTEEAQTTAWTNIREIVRRYGYLISPALRGELFRLSTVVDPDSSVDSVYFMCHSEYESLTEIYYRQHYNPMLKALPKRQ